MYRKNMVHIMWGCVCLDTQSCPTLWEPMDCSPSGSSSHEILPARILEWVGIFSSRESSQPNDQTHISCVSHISCQIPYQYQGYGFSNSHVWMWELDCEECWALKNWFFWRRLLRVLWNERRFNQSILKEISPGISLEGMMVKLKLQ